MNSPILQIKNLSKSLGGEPILHNISLNIFRGETLVILGPSGCGKTVFLKHLVGLLKPDRGEIWMEEKNIAELSRVDLMAVRKKFGVLFQGSALFDSLTVAENVGFALHRHTRLSQDEIKAIVSEKLDLVGLSHIENLLPSSLSGGMKKRVGLARALCMNPEVILYDEPTTGLDPPRCRAINSLILSLQKRLHLTSVVVTHDLESAHRVGDRLALMEEGAIVSVGSFSELQERSIPLFEAFLGNYPNTNP